MYSDVGKCRSKGGKVCRCLDGLALGLLGLPQLAALDGPWEVCDGDDEERVAARIRISFCFECNFIHEMGSH